MKRIFTIFIIFMLIALLSISCLATSELDGKEFTDLNLVGSDVMMINEDEQIENPYADLDVKQELIMNEDDLYEMQDVINHDELNLDGNAYFLGETVSIKDSMINGNVFILAEKIELDNVDIYGSLYLLAESADLKITTLDVYAAGSDIEIEKGSSILRGLRIAGEKLKVAGNIEKNCYLVGNSIDLSSSIILGDLNYSSSQEANLSGANISGNINFTKADESDEVAEKVEKTFFDFFTIGKIFSTILSTFVIGGLILLTSNKFINVNKNTNIGATLGYSLLIGVFALIVVPIVSLMLMLSIVGIGLGFLLLIVYILVLLNTLPIVALAIALAILKNKPNVRKIAILGVAIIVAVVITALNSIPAVRGIVGFLVCVIGLGIIFKTMFTKKVEETGPIQVVDSNNV